MNARTRLDEYLDGLLASARLDGGAARQVRWELGSHLQELYEERLRAGCGTDADADRAADEAIAAFGDAGLIGEAIAGTRGATCARRRTRTRLAAVAAGVVTALFLGRWVGPSGPQTPELSPSEPQPAALVMATVAAPSDIAAPLPVRRAPMDALPDAPTDAPAAAVTATSPTPASPTESAVDANVRDQQAAERAAAVRRLFERLIVLFLVKQGWGGPNP